MISNAMDLSTGQLEIIVARNLGTRAEQAACVAELERRKAAQVAAYDERLRQRAAGEPFIWTDFSRIEVDLR